MSTNPAKPRLLSAVATAAADVALAKKAHEDAVAKRDAAAVKAQHAGATYAELGEASGLARVGVYKMLTRGGGDSE